ncbi:hypothetical protein GOODEAATRI_025302, partial [Goodea atripinnis]
KLTFMVGGAEEEFTAAKELLSCMGANVVYCGQVGTGQDLGLAQNTATNTRTPVPLGSLAHQIYRMMCARGYANKDFSSVFQFLREEEGQ